MPGWTVEALPASLRKPGALQEKGVDRDEDAGARHRDGGDLRAQGRARAARRRRRRSAGRASCSRSPRRGSGASCAGCRGRWRGRVATSSGSERIRTTSAVSTATSVPAPMAMPTSACASAGASLTPSPTIATRRPARWSSATRSALSPGRTSAMTSSMPSSAAMRCAVARLSPVSMTGRMPCVASAATASLRGLAGRIGDREQAGQPAVDRRRGRPSGPDWRARRTRAVEPVQRRCPRARAERALPTTSRRPSTVGDGAVSGDRLEATRRAGTSMPASPAVCARWPGRAGARSRPPRPPRRGAGPRSVPARPRPAGP